MINFVQRLLKKYFYDSAILVLPQIVGILLVLVTLPVVLASLPAEHYGVFQFALVIQMWLIIFSGNHITSGAIKGVANGLDGTLLFSFVKRLNLFLIISLVGGIGCLYFYRFGNRILAILLAIATIQLTLGILPERTYSAFLVAKKRFKEIAFWRITTSVLSLIISVIVVYKTRSILLYVLSLLGISSLVSLIALFYIMFKGRLFESYRQGKIDKECFRYGMRLIPVDLLIVTAGKISHFLIGVFSGFANLAVFSVASKLQDRGMEPARVVIPPLLYADFAKMERMDLIKYVKRHLLKVGILSFLLALAAVVGSKFYIGLFLPLEFQRAFIYFSILALGFPARSMTLVLHTILESHRRDRELSQALSSSNILKIILVFLLGYFWKVYGICIALTIAFWLHFAFYYLFTLRGMSKK